MASHLSTKDRLLSLIDDMELIAKYRINLNIIHMNVCKYCLIIMINIVLER